MTSRVDLCHLSEVEVDLLPLDIKRRALLFAVDHQNLSTGEVEDLHLVHDHLMTAEGDGLHLGADLRLGLPHLLFAVDLLHLVEENTRGTEDLWDIHLKCEIGLLLVTPFTLLFW